jgi:hypothetical protein
MSSSEAKVAAVFGEVGLRADPFQKALLTVIDSAAPSSMAELQAIEGYVRVSFCVCV